MFIILNTGDFIIDFWSIKFYKVFKPYYLNLKYKKAYSKNVRVKI